MFFPQKFVDIQRGSSSKIFELYFDLKSRIYARIFMENSRKKGNTEPFSRVKTH